MHQPLNFIFISIHHLSTFISMRWVRIFTYYWHQSNPQSYKMAKHASKKKEAKEATSVIIILQRKDTCKTVEKTATKKKMPGKES